MVIYFDIEDTAPHAAWSRSMFIFTQRTCRSGAIVSVVTVLSRHIWSQGQQVVTAWHLTSHLETSVVTILSSSWGLCLLGCWRRTKAPPEPVKYLHKQLTFPFTGVQLLCKAGMLTVQWWTVDQCVPTSIYHTSLLIHHPNTITEDSIQQNLISCKMKLKPITMHRHSPIYFTLL